MGDLVWEASWVGERASRYLWCRGLFLEAAPGFCVLPIIPIQLNAMVSRLASEARPDGVAGDFFA